MAICYIMNYCLVMLSRGGKVNVVMKHCRRVKGQQFSTLQMAQQLKTQKILMLYQDNYAVVSGKLKFY